ncbi:hypothetical protein CSUI_010326 [Cystoisospora suis]|uniref:Secreted protein n=1 Tax=Cystoisospora suis TaxID=483139 RepID=A0A2C6JC10_9APIC|nr:hypothetical protein CSUI_010326 [Cystoisospora suis]
MCRFFLVCVVLKEHWFLASVRAQNSLRPNGVPSFHLGHTHRQRGGSEMPIFDREVTRLKAWVANQKITG